MTIGIPRALLHIKYQPFAETFFSMLGAKVIVSPETNKAILNTGTRCCVDDACLPIKVFHGHVAWLRNRCDYLVTPRFMSLAKGKSVCPMFCGLIEMMRSAIPNIPPLIDFPIYSLHTSELFIWAKNAGSLITRNQALIRQAFDAALQKQKKHQCIVQDQAFSRKVALIGHTYLVGDRFINMNLIEKLNRLHIGVVTSDSVPPRDIALQVSKLYKPLFWFFAEQYYGAAITLYKQGAVDGIVAVSAFSCGVDSVVLELIRQDIEDFPLMVLKLDEHTGEAAFDTRLEAFSDMLKRRLTYGCDSATNGQYMSCSQSVL